MNFKKFYITFLLFIILVFGFFVQANATVDIPTINSGSVVLLENSTSKVLFEKDMNKKVESFKEELQKAKTVVWNGPLGLFEFDQFAIGTNEIAKTLSEIDATTIIGGGDSAAAVRKAGLQDKMTHISTGGGASLEFLEGKKLPGIECLQDK